MSKTIWIKCKQVCEYNQQCVVTDEEYKLLKNINGDDVSETNDKEGRKLYRILEAHIDSTEIYDTEHEFLNVEVVLDKPKKKVK